MTYEEIKTNLGKADGLALAGNVAEAYAVVRSMVGEGMTPNDLSGNLSPQAMRKLRAFERKGAH